MKSTDVVGYVHDADAFCPTCAAEMFKIRNDHGEIVGCGSPEHDVEMEVLGSCVSPIFASEEWDYYPCCGACLEEITDVNLVQAE